MNRKITAFKPVPEHHRAPDTDSPALELRELLWEDTLLQVRHYPRPQNVTLGEAKGCDFFVASEGLPNDRFAMLSSCTAGRFCFCFTGDMQGELHGQHESRRFSELIESGIAEDWGDHFRMMLHPGMAVSYSFGPIGYYMRFVKAEQAPKVPWYKRLEHTYNAIMLLFVMTACCFGLYLNSLPVPEMADILDNVGNRMPDIVRFLPLAKKPPPPVTFRPDASQVKDEAVKVAAHEKTGGKSAGSRDDGRKSMLDQQIVNQAGILGMGSVLDSMERLFGGGMEIPWLNDLSESEYELNRGQHGMGTIGAGLGGDGASLGMKGGLGTVAGHSSGYGFDEGAKLSKGPSAIEIETPDSEMFSVGMDKSVIARIIRKRHSQIRYCYQKQLQKDPGLYGKISVSFTIARTGLVSHSGLKVSTMKNRAVEECVVRTIKRIVFPKPAGGGIVQVTYPFLFSLNG